MQDLTVTVCFFFSSLPREYLFLLAKYKFIIAFENAVCPDYVTEKLWKALQVGAVPIYLGAPNVEEYLPNPGSAVLVKDFDSVEAVAEHVLRLDRDESEYKAYLGHKLAHNRCVLLVDAGPVLIQGCQVLVTEKCQTLY